MGSSSTGPGWNAVGCRKAKLSPQIDVIVRDWLCANHVLLTGREGTVLIDTGYVTRAAQTLALLAERLRGPRVDLLVNTHCHSDHMGGNAAVQRRYGCPTLIPEAEAPLIRTWNDEALWLAYADQQAERFDFDGELEAGATYRWGDLDWRMIPAPGHDPGALVFYCEEHRILISGDALWERGFGIVMPDENSGLDDAQRTLEAIAALDIELINLFFLVVGMFLNVISPTFITGPVVIPLLPTFGVDFMHFGLLMTVNLTIGYCTPPVGLSMYITGAMTNKDIVYVTKAVIPFLIIQIAVLFIMTYIPDLVLWLPKAMGFWEAIESSAPAL